MNPTGLVWGLAMIAAMMLSFHRAMQAGIRGGDAFISSVCAAVFGLLGGRVVAELLSSLDVGLDSHRFLFDLNGPKSIIGIVSGGSIAVAAYLSLRGASASAFVRAVLPVACFSYCIARIGCLIEGCCFGAPTLVPWAIQYGPGTEPYRTQMRAGLIAPDASMTLPIHPIPVYEILLALLICCLTSRCPSFRSAPLATLGVLYGGGRFLLESLRGAAVMTDSGLTTGQIASLALVAVGAMSWCTTFYLSGRGLSDSPSFDFT